MDYEKMYKDALSYAKQAYGTGAYDDSTLEAIFPELAESEDERIINAIISFLRVTSFYSCNGCKKPEMIAWLEKQKEQKPHYTKRNALFDKCVENCDPEVMKEVSDNIDEMLQKEQHPSSRFRSGDWVVYDGPLGHAILQIGDVIDGRYTFVDNDSTLLVEDSDKFLRPLTPEDVEKPAECLKAERDGWYVCIKDFYAGGKKQCSVGDLVQAKGGMYMMGKEDISEWFRRAYYEDVRDAFGPNTDTNIPEQKPVELEWPNLSNCIKNCKKCHGKCFYRKEPYEEQKPVEKQDYSGLNDLERAILRGFLAAGIENVPAGIIKDTASECMGFLALIEPEPAEWGEEDEKRIQSILFSIGYCKEEYSNKKDYSKDIDWLKSLPERFNFQPKVEWSEEDEKTINDACCWIAEYAGYLMDKNYGKASMLMSLTDKLKSLRPQQK